MRGPSVADTVDRDPPARDWHHRQVHAGESGTVGAWTCCAGVDGPGGVEYAAQDEIALPRAGFYRKHVGRHVVSADPNHAVFFNRGEEYRVSHPVAGGDSCTLLAPKAEVLDELLAPTASAGRQAGATFPVQSVWLDQRTFAVHAMLLGALRGGRRTSDPVLVEEVLGWLLERVLRAGAQAAGAGRRAFRPLWTQTRAVDRVKEFLAANYGRTLTLTEIAFETPYSPFHLCRLFRDATGLPIHQYLVQLRLRAAVGRLAETRDRLSHLALEVGFSSHSHFSSTFRRTFGVTPSAVRSATDLRDIRAMADAFQAAELA